MGDFLVDVFASTDEFRMGVVGGIDQTLLLGGFRAVEQGLRGS